MSGIFDSISRTVMPNRYARLKAARKLADEAAADEEVAPAAAPQKTYDPYENARQKLDPEEFTKMIQYEERKKNLENEKETIEPLLGNKGVSEEDRREAQQQINRIRAEIDRIQMALWPIYDKLYVPKKRKGGKKRKAKKTQKNKSNKGRRTRHRK